MLKVFRFMGMPDKVLAFENLPESYSKPFELCRADGFPRHWKEWMGKIEKKIPIQPEKDMLSGKVRFFDPIIEEDCFFYLVDWNLKQNEEKWQELTDYVRRSVDKETRLMDKIEDMAKPLARDKSEGVSLEPEEVTVIKIPKEIPQISTNVPRGTIDNHEKSEQIHQCDECTKTFTGSYWKNALRMHKGKHHPLKETATQPISV